MEKYIYSFAEGKKEMKQLLGGKGANLAEMKRLGLPVPDGFTLTTTCCLAYYENGKVFPDTLGTTIAESLKILEQQTHKGFGSLEAPLLISVRSGSVRSMPGMMDTILNIGLNDDIVKMLASQTGDKRFAYDCYRRLIQMFGNVVYSIPAEAFEIVLTHLKEQRGIQLDTELTGDDLHSLTIEYQHIFRQKTGRRFPQDPMQQLLLATQAVFNSWYNPRAITYRQLNNIDEHLGTAVTIQEMVFGNNGKNSGTGVCFTRNPSNGEKKLYGEFLLNAQGEDVVAGIRTPQPISDLAVTMPTIYAEFKRCAALLEQHYQEMQDIEFTIDNGQLYFLQTRNGKRTASAAIQILMDFLAEGLLTKEEVVDKVTFDMMEQALHPSFSEEELAEHSPFAIGLPASPGAAVGRIYFSAEAAQLASENDEAVILVRQETSPEDITGMIVSEAIITSRGGMTSHAAVVARGMGTPCVAGCHDLIINAEKQTLTHPSGQLKEGDWLAVDGSSGKIYTHVFELTQTAITPAFEQLMVLLTDMSDIDVRANADTATDLQTALSFGATGVGLTRTEHMFFAPERLIEMRRLILADTATAREIPLNKLQHFQTSDFEELFRCANERPLTIRLLDPPYHEFLPHDISEKNALAKALGISKTQLDQRLSELQESNPMMGHRGIRLAMSYPEIYKMQVTAIINSALVLEDEGLTVIPEIMIPLVGSVTELKWMRHYLETAITELLVEKNSHLTYKIGTMIEIPRACLTAHEIADTADFFSFGTNDLTQLVYGFSRDDVAKFLPLYLEKGLLPHDPFQTIDIDGVGQLMKQAITLAKKAQPQLKIGVCGELGGDPESVAYFHSIGVDYVSCSPFRVPLAKLALAKASIEAETFIVI